MAPKHKPRRIFLPPVNERFKAEKGKGKESVVLRLDEYEAIRLLDYEGMNQVDVAELMEVSRPTLTRIYEQARRKVALAFVDGRDIEFAGGNVYVGENWYGCNSCDIFFNDFNAHPHCPLCKKNERIVRLNDNLKRD